jgi:L,D-peptidoglycan transpeptidase YkuD (ErfK/YbiS/YcfS/YnhG family)
MIIINKSGVLKYKDLKFRCALGKSGVGNKKREGDNITPKGNYKIIGIYYRNDRVKKLTSKIKLIKIKKNMVWCDDPRSESYNQLIKLPTNFRYEKLFRKENIYDLIIVFDYNMKPIIKNRGSAIFIHVAKKDFNKTAGCIALKKTDLKRLIKEINKKTKIIIN